MKVEDWKRLWEGDGFKLVELRKVEQAEERLMWFLFSINVPYSAQDYGRHYCALLVVDERSGEILKHDTHNIASGDPSEPATNVQQETEDWFMRHVQEGLR